MVRTILFLALAAVASAQQPLPRAHAHNDYDEILTVTRDGKTTRRAVTAIISGNRATGVIAADSPRYAGIGLINTDDLAGLKAFLAAEWRGGLQVLVGDLERIVRARVAALQAALEPADPLLRRPVGE